MIILGLTSNKGSQDFQQLAISGDDTINSDNSKSQLFEVVLEKCSNLGSSDQIMFVVGATKSEFIKRIRAKVPDHFLLIPGVGAQGGSLEEVAEGGMNNKCGLLVNSSRGIIYASTDKDFAKCFVIDFSQQSFSKILLKDILDEKKQKKTVTNYATRKEQKAIER